MSGASTIRVLFFSTLRDAVGGEAELTVDLDDDLPAGATLQDLIDWLEKQFPALATWRSRMLFAIDFEFANPQSPLRANQEIALMPPVQGG
jgi:molybdopterin converting factor small subunit